MKNKCSCGGRWFVYPEVDVRVCLECGIATMHVPESRMRYEKWDGWNELFREKYPEIVSRHPEWGVR